jgi:hypothetical protein
VKPPCPLCSARRPKRACPAIAREICPACCGTKRLTEIACPSDCRYLSAARAHPAAVVQRQQDRDMRFLLPRIAELSEAQYRLFLFFQATVLRYTREAIPAPHDADVADGAASVAATLETARKGIIYEHQAASIPAQRVASAISRALAEVVGRAGAEAGRMERDAAVALRRMESAARDARAEVPEAARPESSWLALADRLMSSSVASEPSVQGEQPSAADAPKLVL